MTDAAAPPAARRLLPAGWPVFVALAALAAVLAVAGVPGPERVAGDGSDKLRRGWAEHQVQSAGETPAREPAPAAPR